MRQIRQLKKEDAPLRPAGDQGPKAKALPAAGSRIQFAIRQKENKTGLPDQLKSSMENLSGYSLDDVKVHYNSAQPAQLNAHAFAQGSQIHIAPGQKKHLAHEAWHVVQQKQGRVKPTKQLKSSVAINDSASLELEADVMGRKAMSTSATAAQTQLLRKTPTTPAATNQLLVQRQEIKTFGGSYKTKHYALTEKEASEGGDKGIGCIMNLEFHAADTVDCDKIGLTQTTSPTVKKQEVKREHYAAARGLARSVADEVEGEQVEHARYFDRTNKNIHPVFGAENPKDGRSLVPASFHSAHDKLGAHVLGKNGKAIKDMPASLLDEPGRDWRDGWLVIQSFETTAVCLNGPMKGDYLGSVEWGYKYGPGDVGSVLPLKKISDGMPSKKFIEAVAEWNKAKIPLDGNKEADTVKLPEKERIGNSQALSLGHRKYMLDKIGTLPYRVVLNLLLDPVFSEHSRKLLLGRLYDLMAAKKDFSEDTWITEAYHTHADLKNILDEIWAPQEWTVDDEIRKLTGVKLKEKHDDMASRPTFKDLARLLEDQKNINVLLCLNPGAKADTTVGENYKVPYKLLNDGAKSL